MSAPITVRLERRRAFSQRDFDAFAALSGDDNPIHVDPDYAARTRFGRPVAHGMLLLAVLEGLAAEFRPGQAMVAHDLRFPAPTFADEVMLFSLWPAGGDQLAFAVVHEADGAVTCDGSLTLAPASLAA